MALTCGSGAYGIVQWLPKTKLTANDGTWPKTDDPSNLNVQINRILWELEADKASTNSKQWSWDISARKQAADAHGVRYPMTFAQFAAAKVGSADISLEELTKAFLIFYEYPGSEYIPGLINDRIDAAKDFRDKYKFNW